MFSRALIGSIKITASVRRALRVALQYGSINIAQWQSIWQSKQEAKHNICSIYSGAKTHRTSIVVYVVLYRSESWPRSYRGILFRLEHVKSGIRIDDVGSGGFNTLTAQG